LEVLDVVESVKRGLFGKGYAAVRQRLATRVSTFALLALSCCRVLFLLGA
jgi:hypothetical protein